MNRGCSGPALGLSLCPSVPWQRRASSRCLSRRGDSGDSRYRLQGPRCSRSCRRRAFTAGCFSNSALYPIMRNEQRPGAQPSPRDGSRSLPRALASCPLAGRVPPCPGGSGPVADARQGRGRAGGGRAAGSFAHQKRLCLRAPPGPASLPGPGSVQVSATPAPPGGGGVGLALPPRTAGHRAGGTRRRFQGDANRLFPASGLICMRSLGRRSALLLRQLERGWPRAGTPGRGMLQLGSFSCLPPKTSPRSFRSHPGRAQPAPEGAVAVPGE